jgi:ADP-ribosylglycohydrolase
MIGALIGDTFGSPYELYFRNIHTKSFDLFHPQAPGSPYPPHPTDDSIMTLAVADLLVRGDGKDSQKLSEVLRSWGHKYPHAGYGGNFGHWLFDPTMGPYQSFGNGAAMRISPVGWFGQTETEVKALAKTITGVTHDNPDSFKAAEVTALSIFYLRQGKDKDFIRQYASRYYTIPSSVQEIWAYYASIRHHNSCQDTLPEALFAFLVSDSFEDCLRTAISLGGDSDTLACISCSIAEAYYRKVPSQLEDYVRNCFRDDKEALALLNNPIFHD